MLISVIIATFNRSQPLRKVLQGLCRQKTEDLFDYEVIVVDNNSTDGTKSTVQSFEKDFSGKLKYLFEARQGKTHALNCGIREAKGDILAFTDDDVVIDAQWLFNLAGCFRAHSCGGVGGRILPDYPPQTPQWVKEHARLLSGPIVLYDYGEDVRPFQRPMLEFLGANFAFKREALVRHGFFREDIGPGSSAGLGEDAELVKRLEKAGVLLYYCGQALVWHPVELKRMTLKYFARWYFNLGRYYVRADGHAAHDESIICYGGVPRYLIREIIQGRIMAPFLIFSRQKFLKNWKQLHINCGRASEMRKNHIHSGGSKP